MLAAVFVLLAVVAGWRCIGRAAEAFLIGAFGIRWAEVGAGDRLNAIVGGSLGLVAIALTGVGVWVALEQRWAAQREAQRKPLLKVVLPNPPSHTGENPDRYQLYIHNEGDKAGAGFWYLGIPKRMRGRVTVEPTNGNEEVVFPGDNWDIFSAFDQPLVSHFTDDYYLLKFMMTQPVEPGVMMPCATVLVQWAWEPSEWLGQTSVEARDQAWRIFGWFTNGPSGRFPETSMRKLRMYSRADFTFKNYHGGKELPENDPEDFP